MPSSKGQCPQHEETGQEDFEDKIQLTSQDRVSLDYLHKT